MGKSGAARFSRIITPGLAGMVLASALILGSAVSAGAASAPALHMPSGQFRSGQRINISVGPNHFFKPYSHVNIIECSDVRKKKKVLPVSISSCDGNTIQADTVLVNKNGSFSARGYEVFALPNKLLGELPHDQPVCNPKKSCVLYVGENQEDFSSPKLFSRSFQVRPSSKHSR
jgi:hypothetical protein